MGVDFYACDECGEVYDDCGHLYNYCEECGKRICFYCQVDLGMRTEPKYFSDGAEPLGDYWDEDDTLVQCPFCKDEIIDDEKLLNYLLEKYNLTREEASNEYKNRS